MQYELSLSMLAAASLSSRTVLMHMTLLFNLFGLSVVQVASWLVNEEVQCWAVCHLRTCMGSNSSTTKSVHTYITCTCNYKLCSVMPVHPYLLGHCGVFHSPAHIWIVGCMKWMT